MKIATCRYFISQNCKLNTRAAQLNAFRPREAWDKKCHEIPSERLVYFLFFVMNYFFKVFNSQQSQKHSVFMIQLFKICSSLLHKTIHRLESEYTQEYCLVPVRRFPVPLGQFTSVTYPRRTGGKRLDKNRMRMRALLFKIQDVVDVVNGRNNVDICGIDFCRPVLKSHENVIFTVL